MPDEMVIFTRTYDLLDWLLPKSEAFPRAYRFTVTQRLASAALDFQEALFDAQSQSGAAARPARRRRRAGQAAAVPAPGPSLALAQRRPVQARQRPRGRDRPAARRLDARDRLRRPGVLRTRGAPPFCMRPTSARRAPAGSGDAFVRAGPPCAISVPSPRPANRGRRALPEAIPSRAAGMRSPRPRGAGPGRRRGTQDVGRTHHPKTDVVVAIAGGVVVAVRRARVVLVVVPGTAAQHTPFVHREPREILSFAWDEGKRFHRKAPSRFARRVRTRTGRFAPCRRCAAPPVSRATGRWGTNTPPENRGRRCDSRGCR